MKTTVKDLISMLLNMPMDAKIDHIYKRTDEGIETVIGNFYISNIVDYEDGEVGLILDGPVE